MPADITSQARNCFKTIEAALKDGGFAMADIVRATYYVTDAKDADAVFAVREAAHRLIPSFPAQSLFRRQT
jgi:enamine deaminase RidA (YjgF/YER057c/UK114 family)